jgi:hypothetical protein
MHGVATGDDVSKLLNPLPMPKPLTSLSDLTKHMFTFLLASQRLTRSGQGDTAYNYIKWFLESVSGFPSIEMCLTTYYYSAYPVIVNQSLATLFPHLENMKDYLLKSNPGTPFFFFRLRAAQPQQAATATSWQQAKGVKTYNTLYSYGTILNYCYTFIQYYLL